MPAPCPAPAVQGSGYCARHWGKPTGRAAKARQRAAEAVQGQALAILEEAGMGTEILSNPRAVDPGVLLLEEVHRCAGIISWLEAKISSLEEDQLLLEEVSVRISESKEATSGQGESYVLAREEVTHEVSRLWRLLQEERKLLTQATTAALRSNIEERRVRLAERGVDALEAAVAAALLDLGLDPHNERVRAIVGKRMREALEGGEAFFSGTQAPGDARHALPVAAERVTQPGDRPAPVSF
jgi:hypothetical protein